MMLSSDVVISARPPSCDEKSNGQVRGDPKFVGKFILRAGWRVDILERQLGWCNRFHHLDSSLCCS